MNKNEFYVILKPSSIEGVGIFAIRNIKKGTKIFPAMNPKPAHIKEIPLQFHKYCILLDDEKCMSPQNFNCMEIAWYMNHSHTPNVVREKDGVLALRDIKEGEEILIDYNLFNEPEHLKESYFKK